MSSSKEGLPNSSHLFDRWLFCDSVQDCWIRVTWLMACLWLSEGLPAEFESLIWWLLECEPQTKYTMDDPEVAYIPYLPKDLVVDTFLPHLIAACNPLSRVVSSDVSPMWNLGALNREWRWLVSSMPNYASFRVVKHSLSNFKGRRHRGVWTQSLLQIQPVYWALQETTLRLVVRTTWTCFVIPWRKHKSLISCNFCISTPILKLEKTICVIHESWRDETNPNWWNSQNSLWHCEIPDHPEIFRNPWQRSRPWPWLLVSQHLQMQKVSATIFKCHWHHNVLVYIDLICCQSKKLEQNLTLINSTFYIVSYWTLWNH